MMACVGEEGEEEERGKTGAGDQGACVGAVRAGVEQDGEQRGRWDGVLCIQDAEPCAINMDKLARRGPCRPSSVRSGKAGSLFSDALWAPPCASILGDASSAARTHGRLGVGCTAARLHGAAAGWRAPTASQPYTRTSMGRRGANRELRKARRGPAGAHWGGLGAYCNGRPAVSEQRAAPTTTPSAQPPGTSAAGAAHRPRPDSAGSARLRRRALQTAPSTRRRRPQAAAWGPAQRVLHWA
jgi:hypothetical protein